MESWVSHKTKLFQSCARIYSNLYNQVRKFLVLRCEGWIQNKLRNHFYKNHFNIQGESSVHTQPARGVLRVWNDKYLFVSEKSQCIILNTKAVLPFEIGEKQRNKWHTSIQWKKAIIYAGKIIFFLSKQWMLIIDILCDVFCLLYWSELKIWAESLLTVTRNGSFSLDQPIFLAPKTNNQVSS